MISSGNILDDYKKFIDVIAYKFKIENKESFNKDFLEYISEYVKPEYANAENVGKLASEKKEDLEKMTKAFFDLINKHSGKNVDFYQGAKDELVFLKKVKEKSNGN